MNPAGWGKRASQIETRSHWASLGWRDDASGVHGRRYWDGHQWSARAEDGGVEVDDPLDDPLMPDPSIVDPADIACPTRRFIGFIIDVVLLGLVWNAVLLQIVPRGSPDFRIAVGIMLLVGLTYLTIPIAVCGRTFGKLIAHTEVVDQASGERLGWGRAAARSGVGLVAITTANGLVVWMAVLILLAFTFGVFVRPWRRAIDDRVARSVVVQRRRRVA